MKELLEKLRRDIRRLRDDVAPFCSDDGINTLMDIHDDLLRTVRKIEAAVRSAEEGAQTLADETKHRTGASSR